MSIHLTPEVAQRRQPAHEVDASFLNRWSPRSFAEREVPEEVLLRVLEAARWAPSASNEQPWRFILARTPEDKERFYSFIAPGNLRWCTKAPVLLLLLSKKTGSQGAYNRAHAFDAGTAWGYLALEGLRQGLITRAMGGFDPDKAREVLGVPDDYDLHVVIAVGYRGEKEALPEDLQEREQPNDRRPLSESLFEGTFGRAVK